MVCPNCEIKGVTPLTNHDASEQAYKNGYSAGYEAGRRSVGVQKWIPVTERLPNLWETVIVCDTREQYVGACMYYGNDDWLHDDKLWDTSEITHWMPLPEPPKEE